MQTPEPSQSSMTRQMMSASQAACVHFVYESAVVLGWRSEG